MEQEIRSRYSEDILRQAMACYGIASDQIRLLDGFESYMYEYEQDGVQRILRLAHSRRRTTALIRGEVDWINYLAAGGARVAQAVPSAAGRLVEEIEDGKGGQFLATAFARAAGGPPQRNELWRHKSFLNHYGRVIGRIHALSKDYVPRKSAWRRPEWDDPVNLSLEQWLPPEDGVIKDRLNHLKLYLAALPKSRQSYGLIHQDAHGGNFFVDDAGQITLFDFDDCVYSWYVYDLSMVLFYAVTNRPDAAEFGPFFWRHFLAGYRQENALDPAWLVQVPHFLKLREIDLYAAIHRSFDLEAMAEDRWVAQFMNGRRERLGQGVPYVSFDTGRT